MADTIVRLNEHTQNYTVICNDCFQNSSLSMQAIGLLAYLITLPVDWKIYKSELVNHFTNGRDAINNAFNELIENGYITCEKTRTEKGTFGSNIYTVHEVPIKTNTTNGKPVTENPSTDKPSTENLQLQSTHIQNTDNTKYTNKHSGGSTADEKKQTFKNEDYQKVYDAYFSNCDKLYREGRIKVPKPVIPVKFKGTIKKAFEDYGVVSVTQAVADSINHDWLVAKGYPFTFIFGPKELPNLINKTYSSSDSLHTEKFTEIYQKDQTLTEEELREIPF